MPNCIPAVQVVAGLGGGLVVPALSSLVASWEPVAEAGRLATVVYTGSQVSCDWWNWSRDLGNLL